jgi:hypothetical protein
MMILTLVPVNINNFQPHYLIYFFFKLKMVTEIRVYLHLYLVVKKDASKIKQKKRFSK